MAKSKNLLAGRRRSRELGEDKAYTEKKAELLAMRKAEAMSSISGPEAEAEAEVNTVVTDLLVMMQQLREAGNYSRFQYSPHKQHQMLLNEIRERVKLKALQQHDMGIDDNSNMAMCQEFVDKIRMGLNRAGLKLNSLFVIKPRS